MRRGEKNRSKLLFLVVHFMNALTAFLFFIFIFIEDSNNFS